MHSVCKLLAHSNRGYRAMPQVQYMVLKNYLVNDLFRDTPINVRERLQYSEYMYNESADNVPDTVTVEREPCRAEHSPSKIRLKEPVLSSSIKLRCEVERDTD